MPSDDQDRRISLIMALRRQGIDDPEVLNAMERIPRDTFVAAPFVEQAYDDRALPIECGQTISQPYVVAFMTQALKIGPRMKVLEVGTGSGYQAAILSRLCRRVYTLERHRELFLTAQKRFDALNLTNITTVLGDGAKGAPAQAPFERIMVTAAASHVPSNLVDQLAPGGIMIVPVGPEGSDAQELIRVRKNDDGVRFTTDRLMPVRFVPLREGLAPPPGSTRGH